MQYVILVLQALVALPKIGAYIEEGIRAIVLWYINGQKSETLGQIADAAAFAARAQTQEDRYQAAEKWQKALSRPRVSA